MSTASPARTTLKNSRLAYGNIITLMGDGTLVYRLPYNGNVVAFKMARRQGARRAHI